MLDIQFIRENAKTVQQVATRKRIDVNTGFFPTGRGQSYHLNADENTFTQDDIAQAIPKILSLLKSGKVMEVQAIVKRFAENNEVK